MLHYPIHRFFGTRDRSDSVSPDMAEVFAELQTRSPRLAALRATGDVAHLDCLIACGAWTDAALALLAIELPQWQLRRLAYDDGAWHCALSRTRDMPDWLDAGVETHHPDMAMAIMTALREAMEGDTSPRFAVVPRTTAASGDFEPVLCDNYA